MSFKDLKNKKRKTRLPAPPSPDKAGNNLDEPEHAPAPPVDGRTLRKTGRTVQLGTKVTPELKRKIKQIAANDGLKIVELLEKAVEAYEEKYSS